MSLNRNATGAVIYFVLQSNWPMRIIRADHLGMCFGVRDAIELALEQSASEPLTVLGDLVHNETVLAELRARGIKIAQSVAAVDTRTVMITAHGASERGNGARARARVEGDGGNLPAGSCGASRGG